MNTISYITYMTFFREIAFPNSREHLLRNLAMPGVLLEMGFITNAAEERKLATPAYQEQIARAIAVGIISYHRRIYSCR